MKQNENNEDLEFLKEKAAAAKPEVPEALSRARIEALVNGRPQKKNLRLVRAAVSVAAAACVLLTSVVVLKKTVFKPKTTAPAAQSAQGDRMTVDSAATYEEIARRLKASQRRYNEYYFTDGTGSIAKNASGAAEEDYAEAAAAPEATDDASYNGVGEARESAYSETNLRTEGVLESDLLKTDGRYLYAVVNGRLLIVDPTGEMAAVSETDLAGGRRGSGVEIYLLGENRLLSVGSLWDEERGVEKTELRLYDVSDAAAPALLRSLQFDGGAVSSRVMGDRLLLVTVYDPNPQVFKAEDYTTFVPSYAVNGGDACYLTTDAIYLEEGDEGDCFTTVALMDLTAADFAPKPLSLFGYAGELYCTADALYLYRDVDVWEETTTSDGLTYAVSADVYTCIRKFDLTEHTPGLVAEGRVPGWVGDGFCMDAYDGYLRVAAGDGAENRVYVLDGELRQVGVSEPLAPGETIRSVRFMGAWGYVVTFLQTDPLFVLDLSDPTAPRVTGEVKLPGFSAYLHPAGEGYLLGIGYGGTEEGTDGSAKISLFDVRDPAHPAEAGNLVIPETELNVSYKAFVTLPDGSFLLPYVQYRQNPQTWDEEIAEYIYAYSATPGALHVAVQNGQPVLLKDLAGEAQTDCWPTVRAAFIGESAFVLSGEWRSLRVERFSLASGAAEASRDFTVEAGEEDPWVVYDDFDYAVVEPAEPVAEPDLPATDVAEPDLPVTGVAEPTPAEGSSAASSTPGYAGPSAEPAAPAE